MLERDVIKRNIEENVIMIPIAGCWIWIGILDKWGYGRLKHDGKWLSAHRLSFSTFYRPIDKDEWILHRCDTPSCVNPHHIYGGTPKQNRMDAINRNRWSHKFGRRDHCSAGHTYVEGSYKLSNRDGSRICKQCRLETKRRARAKQILLNPTPVKR